MAVPTVNVTVQAFDQNGAPAVGASVVAELIGLDKYNNQFVGPIKQEVLTDANGQAIVPLFPNALGQRNSFYRFKVTTALGHKLLDTTAAVPNADCNLATIAGNLAQLFLPQLPLGLSARLTSLDSIPAAADDLPYFASATTFSTTALSAFGRSFIGAATAVIAATALGVGPASSPTFANVGVSETLTAAAIVAGGVITPFVDSGGLGSLFLSTNNGVTGLEVVHAVGAITRRITVTGATASTNPKIGASGGFIELTSGLRFTSMAREESGGSDPEPFTPFYIGGIFVPSSGAIAIGQWIAIELSPGAGFFSAGLSVAPKINKAASGTHADFASIYVEPPVIGAGAGALTNASTVTIHGAPTVGDVRRALWVTAGLSEFDSIKTGAPAGGTAMPWKFGTVAVVSPTAPNRTVELDVNGTIYYLAAKTTNN